MQCHSGTPGCNQNKLCAAEIFSGRNDIFTYSAVIHRLNQQSNSTPLFLDVADVSCQRREKTVRTEDLWSLHLLTLKSEVVNQWELMMNEATDGGWEDGGGVTLVVGRLRRDWTETKKCSFRFKWHQKVIIELLNNNPAASTNCALN